MHSWSIILYYYAHANYCHSTNITDTVTIIIILLIVPALIAVPDIDPGTSLKIATIDVSCKTDDLGHLMCNRSVIVSNSECTHSMDVGLSCVIDGEENVYYDKSGYIYYIIYYLVQFTNILFA